MAAYAKHVSAGAAATQVDLTGSGNRLRVTNTHATQVAYFTRGTPTNPPATAVVAADDTWLVPANGSIEMAHYGNVRVSIIASGAATPCSVMLLP